MPGGVPAERVFISYSSADRPTAFTLLKLLKDGGADAWMDFFDIKPASGLESELTANLDAASTACILLSPASVASKWVEYEVRHALARQKAGLRILPIILRPCRIPDDLSDLVAIDASSGLGDEAVRLRVIRAVAGAEQVADGVLLTAGQRSAWAKQELEADVQARLPELSSLLDRVRGKPIRSIRLVVDHHSFPADPGLIVELRLHLNAMWTTPIRFYFARYREGSTWPAKLGFSEPPHEDFALDKRPRIDGKFRWFDRVDQPIASIDGTDDHSMLATFSLEFDGSEFLPASRRPVTRQRFEIPSLRQLADDRSGFALTTYLNGAAEEWPDPELSAVDVTVSAYFPDEQPQWVQLFSSRHSPERRTVLMSPAMATIANPIEREALTGLYPAPPRPDTTEKRQALTRAVLEEKPVADEDVRLAAHLAVEQATVLAFRHQNRDAFRLYSGAARLLEPLVMNGYPSYEEGVLLVRACAGVLGCLVSNKQYDLARRVCDPVFRVPARLSELYCDEPEYRRLTARGLVACAEVYLANGDKDIAGYALTESVEIWRALAHDRPSPERLAEARLAYLRALDLATRGKIAEQLPVSSWADELDPDRMIQKAVEQRDRRQQAGPAWMMPAEPDNWPTVSYESPALRYRIRVPQRWAAEPNITATSTELQHVFHGSSPATLMSVRFMDKAVPGHNMRLWVEVPQAVTGFPVVELVSGGEPPRLLDWEYEGEFQVVADRLGLDEVHCWSGVAQLDQVRPPLRRVYVAAFRKETFAWLITLVIETAALPGMPQQVIEVNDHVRAGASYGHVQLG